MLVVVGAQALSTGSFLLVIKGVFAVCCLSGPAKRTASTHFTDFGSSQSLRRASSRGSRIVESKHFVS